MFYNILKIRPGIFIWFWLCCFLIFDVKANGIIKDKVYPNRLNTCIVSRPSINNYEPEIFNVTNNLLRKVGEKPSIKGEIVVIKGKLLDKKCVPVSDAKIYLWQVGDNGKYPYTPLRNVVNKVLISKSKTSSFVGSGITTTDNNGNFYFITISPKKISNIGPYFNFRIEHRELGNFQTMHVVGKSSNIVPQLLLKDPKIDIDIECNFQTEYVTLVMPQASKLKRY